MVVLNDRIIYVGPEEKINLTNWQLTKIDLQSRHIYPGFIDCHTHLASVALDKSNLRLDHCQSLKSALDSIESFAQKQPKGSWILGGGWNANLWADGFPHKNFLDKLVPNHPIALFNKDGHGQWLNSMAMNICQFNSISDTPAGGKLACDDNGDLTGLVYEKACDSVNRKIGKINGEVLKQGMKLLLPELHALGITSVHSCESMEIWCLFQELNQQKDLNIRICMHPPMEHKEDFINGKLCSGYGDEWLRLGGLKYFVDGSLGSQTAEMFENYSGSDQTGVEIITESELIENLHQTALRGLSATVHAIGDKANHKTLNAFENVHTVSNEKGLRHRIEHAQILREDDIHRFGTLNIIASMQPMHISDDVRLSDKYLGSRTKTTYPINSLRQAGCQIVFGSDMPVADPDPIKGIRAAVGRRYLLDKNEPRWHPEQSISAEQALLSYTRDAAYASYEENLKGTLIPGKLADFIVLSNELESADENSLAEIKVKMTVLGGEIVYRA